MSVEEPESELGLSPDLLNETLPTPLYHQIYTLLREKICRGDIAAGATLPGEQEMARQLNVSRITVKRSLNELAADNLVTRHRGRGTIVASGIAIPVVRASFDNLIESLRLMGLETQIELIDVGKVVADAALATILRVRQGAPLQRAIRRRMLNDEPFAYLVSFVPAEIAARYTNKDLAETPLLTLLERAGNPGVEAEQWITAVGAGPKVAAALDVAEGSPVLRIDRVMTGRGGDVVQLMQSYYVSDRFQYHVRTHSRRQSQPTPANWNELLNTASRGGE